MSAGDPDADLEREIRESRKFSPQEALARMAGPGAMKGASPISQAQQAEIEVGTWLRGNVPDPGGALPVVLHRHLKDSRLLLDNVEQPLVAIRDCCCRLLASDERIDELVREADVEWGRIMDERPYFQKAGAPAHPDDPYTSESVRIALSEVVARLQAS